MPKEETTLYTAHASMSRNHPFLFFLVVLLCFVGVGLILLLIWRIRCQGTTLTVTDRRTILRKGILSKFTNEVRHDDVTNIQVRQTFFQRICGTGSIGISSDAQSDIEIQADGIPHPEQVAEIINEHQSE